MNGTPDQELCNLLLEDAPPERDPFFRIGVIGRRTRQRYQRRQRTMFAIAAAVAVLPAVGYAAIVAFGASLLPGALVVIFGAALVTAGLFAFRGVRQAMRQLRASAGARHG